MEGRLEIVSSGIPDLVELRADDGPFSDRCRGWSNPHRAIAQVFGDVLQPAESRIREEPGRQDNHGEPDENENRRRCLLSSTDAPRHRHVRRVQGGCKNHGPGDDAEERLDKPETGHYQHDQRGDSDERCHCIVDELRIRLRATLCRHACSPGFANFDCSLVRGHEV